MSADSEPLPVVYEVTVTETFHSPYGDFQLVQSCYSAHTGDEWTLLWSYRAEDAEHE